MNGHSVHGRQTVRLRFTRSSSWTLRQCGNGRVPATGESWATRRNFCVAQVTIRKGVACLSKLEQDAEVDAVGREVCVVEGKGRAASRAEWISRAGRCGGRL